MRRANRLLKSPKGKDAASENALDDRLMIASTYDSAFPIDVLSRSGAQLIGSVAALVTRQEDGPVDWIHVYNFHCRSDLLCSWISFAREPINMMRPIAYGLASCDIAIIF